VQLCVGVCTALALLSSAQDCGGRAAQAMQVPLASLARKLENLCTNGALLRAV